METAATRASSSMRSISVLWNSPITTPTRTTAWLSSPTCETAQFAHLPASSGVWCAKTTSSSVSCTEPGVWYVYSLGSFAFSPPAAGAGFADLPACAVTARDARTRARAAASVAGETGREGRTRSAGVAGRARVERIAKIVGARADGRRARAHLRGEAAEGGGARGDTEAARADDIALARELWSGTCGSMARAARRALFRGAPQTDAWEIALRALRTVGFGADLNGLDNVTHKS